jgi:hypothetical protein
MSSAAAASALAPSAHVSPTGGTDGLEATSHQIRNKIEGLKLKATEAGAAEPRAEDLEALYGDLVALGVDLQKQATMCKADVSVQRHCVEIDQLLASLESGTVSVASVLKPLSLACDAMKDSTGDASVDGKKKAAVAFVRTSSAIGSSSAARKLQATCRDGVFAAIESLGFTDESMLLDVLMSDGHWCPMMESIIRLSPDLSESTQGALVSMALRLVAKGWSSLQWEQRLAISQAIRAEEQLFTTLILDEDCHFEDGTILPMGATLFLVSQLCQSGNVTENFIERRYDDKLQGDFTSLHEDGNLSDEETRDAVSALYWLQDWREAEGSATATPAPSQGYLDALLAAVEHFGSVDKELAKQAMTVLGYLVQGLRGDSPLLSHPHNAPRLLAVAKSLLEKYGFSDIGGGPANPCPCYEVINALASSVSTVPPAVKVMLTAAFDEAGIVSLIVNNLVANAFELQKQACVTAFFVIGYIVKFSPEHKSALLRAGAVNAVLLSLRFHYEGEQVPDHEWLFDETLYVLNSLVCSKDNRSSPSEEGIKRFVQDGGVQALYKLFDDMSEEEESEARECIPAILAGLEEINVRKEVKNHVWSRRRHLCIDRVQARAASAADERWMRQRKGEAEGGDDTAGEEPPAVVANAGAGAGAAEASPSDKKVEGERETRREE